MKDEKKVRLYNQLIEALYKDMYNEDGEVNEESDLLSIGEITLNVLKLW